MKNWITQSSKLLTITLTFGVLLMGKNALANRPLKVAVEQRAGAQVVFFSGGLNKETPYKKIKSELKKLVSQKDILLVIQRGFGGSVGEHKKLVRALENKCQGSCKIITYLDGQCSSMCTTLFLIGDIRMARDDRFANLGFHRTFIKVAGRNVPIQSANSLVTYFSKFEGVDKEYLKKNKVRLFKRENNQLSQVNGDELIVAGFASELIEAKYGDYQELYKSLNIDE